jgi:malate dehydrogenase (oxaloacetate-decarboxylating)(NADP+)
VAVVTNGTAVLGLGDIGPEAAKPVMEGKAVLFKKFAGIDVFDLELRERDPEEAGRDHCRAGAHLRRHQPRGHQGAGLLRGRALLRERMKIPVFHDDQHGTAIVVGAAVMNGLKVLGKKLDEVKLVTSGAGAAALACLNLLVKLGVPRKNIWVTDLAGVVYEGRTELMDPDKASSRSPPQRASLPR